MKFIVLGRLKRIFEANEATKELVEYVATNFRKNATDRDCFQALNQLVLAKLADKRAQIQKAYELHDQMLLLASLKGQKLAITSIQKLTIEYQELYKTYRRFVKQFPALNCPLQHLRTAEKASKDQIEEANSFFTSVLANR